MPDRSLTCSNKRDSRCLPNLFGFIDFLNSHVLRRMDSSHLACQAIEQLFGVGEHRVYSFMDDAYNDGTVCE